MRLADKIATMARRGAPLPYDAEVEYIESTTGQYIDTGKSLLDGDVNIHFALTTTGGDRPHFGYGVYGSWKGSSVVGLSAGFGVRQYGGKFRISNGNGSLLLTDINIDLLPHTISTVDNLIYFDGTYLGVRGKVTTIGVDTVDNITIGGYRQGGLFVSGSGYVRTYSCTIGTGLDLIPVRFTNENGVSEGAIYDRVSGQLFRNAGTGAFIIGPDKT